MNDTAANLRTMLTAAAGITTAFGSRVYAETLTPPPGYQPSVGKALCFGRRGAVPAGENDGLMRESFQFKCYGATPVDAQAGFRALFDALNFGRSLYVKGAVLEGGGETLQEPDSGWNFVLAYFLVLSVR